MGTLTKFKGMTALIQVVPDFESQILANEIAAELRKYGWEPRFIDPSISKVPPLGMAEGVEIWTRLEPDDSEPRPMTPSLKAWRAAETLSAVMADQGIRGATADEPLHHIDLTWTPVMPPGLPDGDIRNPPPEGVVVILVGMKPATLEFWRRQLKRERAESVPTK